MSGGAFGGEELVLEMMLTDKLSFQGFKDRVGLTEIGLYPLSHFMR